MSSVLDLLKGGDLRSIGRANQVVKLALQDPLVVAELVDGLESESALIRMRTADALEKVGLQRSDELTGFAARLIQVALRAEQQEVRWHLALIFSYLELSPVQRRRVSAVLFEWLGSDTSKIVQVSCLQSLVCLADADPVLRKKVIQTVRNLERVGSSAVRARCRKLLSR